MNIQPGYVRLHMHYAGPDDLVGRPRIDHADPVAWISAEILDEIRSGNYHPDVTVDGDLLTIRGSNRTVIYRIGEKDFGRLRYLMAWPD